MNKYQEKWVNAIKEAYPDENRLAAIIASTKKDGRTEATTHEATTSRDNPHV